MHETSAAAAAHLKSASAKVRRRLLPFLVICYFAAYLDRVNVGFAALTMNRDLGIGPEAFGFTAGVFFLGYCLFEVPSNVILDKVGARLWIARIMITWGIVSAAMAFVTDAVSLSLVRFLLGVAEAGFFPGIIYYLTRWVPSDERARVIGLFMTAVPVSTVIGAPLSGFILDTFDGFGAMAGWRWLFVIDAIPSVVLGVIALRVLTDRPEDARWLSEHERTALASALAREAAAREKFRSLALADALMHPRVLMLSLVYFGIVASMYGLTFWLPQIIQSFGLSNTMTGVTTAVPYFFAAAAMTVWGAHSDRTGERVWHIALPCFVGGVALITGTAAGAPAIALLAITFAAIGIFTALPTFWTLPSALLTGSAAAAGIAMINAIGNIGGFIGPYLIGWLQKHDLTVAAAVSSLAAFAVMSGVIVLALGDRQMRDNGH